MKGWARLGIHFDTGRRSASTQNCVLEKSPVCRWKPTLNLSVGQFPLELKKLVVMNNKTAKTNTSTFNLEDFRIPQEGFAEELVEQVLTTVKVDKPAKDQFIRVHPGEEYRMDMAILEKDGESYLVANSLRRALREESMLSPRTLVLGVTRDNIPFIWPLKQDRTNTWNASAFKASEEAMVRWVRVRSDRSAQQYNVLAAKNKGNEPVWPKETFHELLEIAFQDKMISDMDHPVLQELHGE